MGWCDVFLIHTIKIFSSDSGEGFLSASTRQVKDVNASPGASPVTCWRFKRSREPALKVKFPTVSEVLSDHLSAVCSHVYLKTGCHRVFVLTKWRPVTVDDVIDDLTDVSQTAAVRQH